MSQERNIELVRRAEEAAFRRRDIKAFLDCFHPRVEFVLRRNVLEGGSYRGLDGVRRALADMSETWADLRYERQDVRAIDDLVVSLGEGAYVGKGAAPTVESQTAWVCKIHQGKILKAQVFGSHSEALKAAGLEE